MRLLLAIIAGSLLGGTPVFAADTADAAKANEPAITLDAIQRDVQAIFHKCRDAVVRIEAEDERGYLSGSGFFIDPNGMLYTSYTVGGESHDIHVSFNGAHYKAQRLVSDIRSGVAILKIEAETPFLTFGDSHQLSVASPVIAIGYPMDLPLTPVFGTVGGFELKYQGRFFATTHIRANLPVQRGEGGAPLVNSHGEVVGILISRLESGNGSFVLPIEAAEKVRKDFMRFHDVRPGWIGVRIKPLEEPVNGSTAEIEEVLPDAPAEKAGLHAGDVIVQVGNHQVSSPEDVLAASFFLTATDETTIRVARDGSEQDFSVMPVDPRPVPAAIPAPAATPAPAAIPAKADQ
ncbi:PDZ/DHR/GLGF domain protein [Chthoniobacter flavus Ellin428]|uniref:PDZ/DHR/GLGF domain protein n=1 Tax=Chthoniobacter flavus Ellin428 TaxID=497964 RepID=B4D0E7_9BACT|nr:trypsin-like peptidase domain-containing protein [Chthoniobacter flavus]EDY19809.1 PDZ/DHR/GLGF domain protein [Chthoniobacter flavus Ellin428]TCO91917.1 S1-C subfamily serine protease [Chthoniobacter flavus]